MIDIGVARPSAHGQAMIRTATALTSAWASRASSGPAIVHTANVATAAASTRGHEVRRHHVGEPLDRRAAALAPSPTHAHDLGEHGRAADALGAHHELPVPLIVPAVTAAAGGHLDRERLAGDQRLVDRAGALDDDAVDRQLLARTDPQPVARTTRSIAISCSLAVAGEPARGARGEIEQRPDRAGRRAARARSSSTWPSRTSVVITAAGSKYTGGAPPWPPGPANACGSTPRRQHRDPG